MTTFPGAGSVLAETGGESGELTALSRGEDTGSAADMGCTTAGAAVDDSAGWSGASELFCGLLPHAVNAANIKSAESCFMIRTR